MSILDVKEGQFLYDPKLGMAMIHFPPKQGKKKSTRVKGTKQGRSVWVKAPERQKTKAADFAGHNGPILVYLNPNIPPIPLSEKSRPSLFYPPKSEEFLNDEIYAAQRREYPAHFVSNVLLELSYRNEISDTAAIFHYGSAFADSNEGARQYANHAMFILASIEMYFKHYQGANAEKTKASLLSRTGQAKIRELFEDSITQFGQRFMGVANKIEAENKARAEEAEKAAQEEAATVQREARRETVLTERAEKLEVQKEIVKASAEKVRGTSLVVSQRQRAIDSLQELHAEEKIRFRTAILLLRHEFGSEAKEETVALINEHNPPSKGAIEVGNLRKQLQAAIDDVQKATNDNSEHSVLRARVDGINPKRFQFG
ncbi:MAG: hypothetical protein AAF569_03945 [Pseudomonadota bacterium]